MKYRYYTCDVFTETRFGGNPLAVLPQANGLSQHQMQQIAREFNFSESTFVFPPRSGYTHHPQICSVGLPFVFTELRNRAALERARINMSGFDALRDLGVNPQLHLYTRVSESEPDGHVFDIRARMFAPLSGVAEDPATGSANCTLGGLLAHHKEESRGTFSWRIAQDVEMGRPSTLIARAEKKNGVVTGTWIGGATVLVSEGILHLE